MYRYIRKWAEKEGLLLALLLLFLGMCIGCAKKQAVAQESYVQQKLREAAEGISYDLQLLTGSMNRDGYTVEEALVDEIGLSRKMDLFIDAPVETALQCVAAEAGYRLQKTGTPPQVSPYVHIRVKSRPCSDVLREIGLQTGERILVNEAKKIITLHYK